MTIILERLCISPTEAIRQGDKPYMQHAICPAPTAYQASYQAHPPAPLPKGTRNAFPALDGEGMKSSTKCEDCNEALCFTYKQNCFHEFHHM